MIHLVLSDQRYRTIITKMEPAPSDRIPWERQYYGAIVIPNYSKTIKCEMCGTAFFDNMTEIHIEHLNIKHYKTELTDHPQHEFFLQNFIINEKKFEAECTCKEVIVYNKYGLYLLKNHFEIYHGNSSDIYKTIAMTKSGRDTLDKYIIMGSEATCPKCELKIDMTHSETQAAEKAEELLEHYFSHRSISQQDRDEYMRTVYKELKEEQKRHVRYLKNKLKLIKSANLIKERERKRKVRYLKLKEQQEKERYLRCLQLKMEEELQKKRDDLHYRSISTETSGNGRTVQNEPGPSTSRPGPSTSRPGPSTSRPGPSTSRTTADYRTERSEQSGVPQNIASSSDKET